MRNFTGARLASDQRGIVSITVTMVFIVVISLTVLGFSQVTQRNAREALDRQLSEQAYYAAETGVNDVMSQIAGFIERGDVPQEQDECTGDYTVNNGQVIPGDTSVFYSCLLVDPTPSTLVYNNVNDSSVIVPLNATPPKTLDRHTLKWKRVTTPPATAAVNKCKDPAINPIASDWVRDCPFGLLRVDIFPTNDTTLGDPMEAAKATMTLFIYPKQGNVVPDVAYTNAATNAYGTGALQGLVRSAACDADTCQLNLTNLNFANAYMRVRSLYVPTPTFMVDADAGNSFSNSQIVIDVTGKAQDVLRRIKVQMSANGGSSRTDMNGFSDYAIQSTDSLCKRYVTAPNFAALDPGSPCSN